MRHRLHLKDYVVGVSSVSSPFPKLPSTQSTAKAGIYSEAPPFLLSAEAEGELDDAGVGGGAGDAAEGRGAEAAVGLGEGGGVDDVEELGAELEVGFAGEWRVFDESQVEVAIGGAADWVA